MNSMMLENIDLSGSWQLAMDNVGNFVGDIELPGSLQNQGFGNEVSVETPWTGQIVNRSWYTDARYERYRQPGNIKIPFWLQPECHFIGEAWYRRTFHLPQKWVGKRIVLFLERAHITTTVHVDHVEIGSRNCLGAPHVYDLGANLSAGAHELVIHVDNRLSPDIGYNSHSVTDHTQTNWNGIIGEISLYATSLVWMEEVQVFPDIETREARLNISIGNITGKPGSGVVTVGAATHPIHWENKGGDFEITIPFEVGAPLWDEFTPVVHRIQLHLHGDHADDTREVVFGFREVRVKGTQFEINKRKTFLRGTLECAVFPKTGYPSTDIAEWRRILGVIKEYGFNHVRFHSWCPPEAAFTVADDLGLYLQIECSSWANETTGLGLGQAVDSWLYKEAHAIIKAFGNHPSFTFMTYGNEPAGQFEEYLKDWLNYWKVKEPRRLHTAAAGWPALVESNYDNIPEPRIQAWGSGLKSRINAMPPSTTADYRDFVQNCPRPIVSHEIGQWCAYPDFSEIPQYTGLLKAKNFEIFRDFLSENHMADLASHFLNASGKLQMLCYREDMESALRTKGFGGFQILGASDFPGQGTATVGWLNAFWESKGYITPEEVRRFNNATVILARLERRTYTTQMTLQAEIEVAHFEKQCAEEVRIVWRLTDESGNAVKSGEFPRLTLAIDHGIRVGRIECPLRDLPTPAKYRLVVQIEGTSLENDWEIWIYPEGHSVEQSTPGLRYADSLDQAMQLCEEGATVLFCPGKESGTLPVELGFSTIFWNTAWTRGQAPHTLGIFCDPTHPVLAHFPTESHSNWQWWEILQKAKVFTMDHLPPDLRPLVHVIDDWTTARRLGLMFEAKLKNGKLLVCGIDLISEPPARPVASQLYHSIIQYMLSDQFAPQYIISAEELAALFPCSSAK